MSASVGFNQKLYYNAGTYDSPSWVEIDIVKDNKVPNSAGEADVTTRSGGGYSQKKQGLKELSFEFNILYDPESTVFEYLRDAFIDGTPVDLWASDLEDGEEGAQGPRAVCELFKFDKGEALADGVMVDIVAKPTYTNPPTPPTWFEQA